MMKLYRRCFIALLALTTNLGASSPRLDLQVWNPGLSTTESKLAIRISNHTDEPVAISRLSVKAWVRDTAPADLFQVSTFDNNQTIYSSSGQWVANVPMPQAQIVALGSVQDCGASRTADKAVQVAFSGSLEIPAGGYLETNPGSVLAGWHRQSWSAIDRSADYSRVQDAGGSSAGRSDLPQFGLFVDSALACEWKTATQQDPASGRQPCTNSACDATPTPTPTPTTTGTFTFPGAPFVPGACGATPPLDLKVRQISATGSERVYRFQVYNRGSQPIALNALQIALWGHESSPLQGDVYWSGEVRDASGNWAFNQVALNATVQATAECAVPADRKANQRIRFSATDARSIPAGGAWVDIQVRFRRADYGSLSSSDDYTQTPAYQGGQLSDQAWPTVYGDSNAFVLYHQGAVVQERTAQGVDALRGQEPACLQSCVEPVFGEVLLPVDGKTSGLLGALEVRPELAGSPLVASSREIVGSGSNRSIGVLVKTNDGLAGVDSVLEQVLGVSGDIVAGRVRLDRLDDLRLHPNVLYARESSLNKLSMDRSRVEIGQAAVETDPKLGADGSGVRVAVVDSGIDWCHADFKNPDGSTRIRAIWDQTLTPLAGETPGPGGLGVLYSRTQIDAAIAACNTAAGGVRSVDSNGHGTHVASTAAGQNGVYKGVAPGSELVIVKTNMYDTGITAALDFFRIFEAPQGLGLKTEVTNLSLGSHYGAHDGSDLLSLAVDSYQGTGGVNSTAVVAAGNEGADDIHAQVAGAGSYVDLPFAFYVTAANQVQHLEVWVESGGSFTGVQVITPDGAGPLVLKNSGFSPGTAPHDYYVNPQGLQAQNCQERIDLDLLSNVGGQNYWTLRIHGLTAGRLVDAWVSSPVDAVFSPAVANASKTLGIPGANRAALTVASYVNKPVAGAGGLSTFSSRGPLRAHPGGCPGFSGNVGIQKPDIAAPGQRIVAARSSFAPAPAVADQVGTTHRYMDGTSMASPHVAGAVAVIKAGSTVQNLSNFPDRLRDIIHGSARRDALTGGSQAVPNHDSGWGYGKLNVEHSTIRMMSGTWLQVPLPGTTSPLVRKVLLSPAYASDKAIFALTDQGLFKSKAGGAFVKLALPSGVLDDHLTDMALAPGYDETVPATRKVFISSVGQLSPVLMPAVYRSDAGGEGGAWTELAMAGIPAPSAEGHPRAFITRFALSPVFATDQTIFAAFFGDAGIWKSIDGGNSWTQSLAGTASNFEQLTVSPSYATDQRIWAKAMHGPLLRSDNGGGTWASKQAGLPVYPALPNGAMGALEARNLPTGTMRIFAAGWDATLPNSNDALHQNYFAHSDNGGDTWVVDRGIVSATPGSGGHAPLRSVAISPQFVKDGGILVGLSTESGGTFLTLRRLMPTGPSNWVTEGGYFGNPVSAVLSLAISPTWHEDATVYAGTDGGLFVDPLNIGSLEVEQSAATRSTGSAKTLGWHVEALSLEALGTAALEPGDGAVVSLSLTVKVPLSSLRFSIKASDGTVIEEHAVSGIAPGTLAFSWDGMDGSGHGLPAGVYTAYVTAQWGGIYAYRSKIAVTVGTSVSAEGGTAAVSAAKVGERAMPKARRSGLGRNVLAPSPVPKGQPLCLFPKEAVYQSTWRVFGLDGSLVALAEYEGEDQCMDTSKLAPGLYVVVLEMKGRDLKVQREMIKVVVR